MRYYRAYNVFFGAVVCAFPAFLWLVFAGTDSPEKPIAPMVAKAAAGPMEPKVAFPSHQQTLADAVDPAPMDEQQSRSLSEWPLQQDYIGMESIEITDASIDSSSPSAAPTSPLGSIDNPIVIGNSSASSGSGASGGGSSGGGASGGGSSGGGSTDETSDETAPAPSPAPATGGGTGGISFISDLSVTVLSGMERLLRDDISAPGDSSAELFSARNETEAFQIIVTNGSNYSLPDVEIHVSDWEGPAGPQPKLTLFREHYVKTEVPSRGLPEDTPVGWYPSALIPFVDPYTAREITSGLYRADHADVGSRQNQGYWVDVRVDTDVSAGTYTCSMLVTSRGRKVAEFPVTLNVWDFELPAVRQWTTWFLQFQYLGKLYGLSQETGPHYDLVRSRHWDIMYEHGIYPTFVEYPSFDNDGNVNFSSYERKLKAFEAKYGPGVLRIPFYVIKDGFDEHGNNPVGAQILADYHEFSLAHPEYGQFFYIIDEPYTLEKIDQAVNIANLIDTYAPSIKLVTNGDVYEHYYKDMYLGSAYHPGGNPEYADYVNMANAVEAASDIRSFYSRTQMQPYTTQQTLEASMQSALNSGKTVWVCQTSKLEQPLLMFRMASWRGYVLGATGQLEWRMMSSDHQLDPWVNSVNFTDGGHKWNGYDQYVYPGTPNRVGLSGPGGPVAAIGLKVYRSSVEDYAYFKLAESLTDRQTVLDIVAPVTPDFKTAGSLEAYESARQDIARLILDNL